MNKKTIIAAYISTMVLLLGLCAASCAVFVPVDSGPPAAVETSRTTTTTQTTVPDPSVSTTTQKTTVKQSSGY